MESLTFTKALIGGKWTDAQSGKTFVVKNPATQEVVAHVAECDVSDAKAAIDNASEAFAEFKNTGPFERAAMLRKWHSLIAANTEVLAKIITAENGKPLAEARGEVGYANSFTLWFSEEATRVSGETIATVNQKNRLFTVKQPVGPCGILTPWNFPAAMITRKVAAAVAAGCTCVIKPAADTPLTALALAHLALEAGIPAGVINVVPTDVNTPAIGQEICENPKLKKVSFTGSTRVGKLLMSQSSSSLKKLSFELGGNAPFIVFDDANLDTAISSVMASKFRHTGQTCVCANRIFVHKKVYKQFTDKLLAEVKKCKVGHGSHDGTTHGPLISPRAVDKVQSHIKDATAKGASIAHGGEALPELGPSFHALTIVTDVKPNMLCAQEETFGPLAALIPFESEKEVLDWANSAEVGLASYFFTNDIARVYRMAEGLETGMVGVNTGLISEVTLPFGGVKDSGFGREGSKYGIEEYLVVKSVTVGLA